MAEKVAKVGVKKKADIFILLTKQVTFQEQRWPEEENKFIFISSILFRKHHLISWVEYFSSSRRKP